jgi:hypothetical protein
MLDILQKAEAEASKISKRVTRLKGVLFIFLTPLGYYGKYNIAEVQQEQFMNT